MAGGYSPRWSEAEDKIIRETQHIQAKIVSRRYLPHRSHYAIWHRREVLDLIPPAEKRIVYTVNLSISEAVKQKIQQIANREGLSVARLIVLSLMEYADEKSDNPIPL